MSVKNKALEAILSRRSIRRFKPDKVPNYIVEQIVQAGQRAPTAENLQAYSFIIIEDINLRKKIAQICEEQVSAKEAPVILIFCADLYKAGKIADYLKLDHCLKHGLGLSEKFFAIFDACFAAENIVIASELFGLGSVMLGEPFDKCREIAKLLHLPHGVLPISLICIGYPAEDPPLRPRWPLKCVLFRDSYRKLSKFEIENYVKSSTYTKELGDEWQRDYLTKLDEYFNLKRHKYSEQKLRKDLKKTGFL